MGITEEGIQGEQMLFEWLRAKGFEFFQPDAIGTKNGTRYIFETKHQERYKTPPFDGHGLPIWQVNARLKFEEETGIKAILVVFDKETNEVFYESIKNLEKGKICKTMSDTSGDIFDTTGKSPRRIYKLNKFKVDNPTFV